MLFLKDVKYMLFTVIPSDSSQFGVLCSVTHESLLASSPPSAGNEAQHYDSLHGRTLSCQV